MTNLVRAEIRKVMTTRMLLGLTLGGMRARGLLRDGHRLHRRQHPRPARTACTACPTRARSAPSTASRSRSAT